MASTLAASARAAFGSIAPAQCGPQRHDDLHSGVIHRGRSRACILPPRSIGQKDRPLVNNWAGSELRAVKGALTRDGTNRRAAGIRCSADNGAPKTKEAPIKIILSGPPASGKGTQAEELVKKYKVVHIAAGDLLRAEVAAGSENGKRAKALMDGGNLVPDEIVVTLVKERLAEPDVQQHGWLLDGYPRSESQAAALEKEGIHPDAFVILRVPDSSIVDRITGRRLDPETGKIYHMKYKKPESDEIAKRLVTRSDDTVDKVKTRLEVYSKHLNDVASLYLDEIVFVDGNRPPQDVFQDIDAVVQKLQSGEKEKAVPPREEADVRAEAEEVARESLLDKTAIPPPGETATAPRPEPVRRPSESLHDSLEPIPLRLNTTPYPREIREHFYREACLAAKNAVNDGLHQLEIRCIIPELNPEMDVYRIGTLLELMRELAFTFADDGKRVKVCVQGSMGDGIFSGMPLALAGTRRIIESMDWGDEEDKANFIRFGAVGAKEVTDEDDLFIVMAPQNAVANCIIPDLEAMLEAAGTRPLIIVNPRLKDVPSSAGVMQIRGREERERFTASFFQCYNFRLLYKAATNFYPIMGALRYVYPGKYEVYRRKDMGFGEERYDLLGEFDEEPMKQDLGDVLYGRRKVGEKKLKTRGLFG